MNKRRVLSNLQRDGMSWALIVLVLFLIAWAAIYLIAPQLQPRTTLRLGDGVFTADIVEKSNGSVVKAIETRPLEVSSARLLIYPYDAKWPITIKSHSNSMDIVWLNHDKKVVYIVKNVEASDSGDVVYTPKKAARYVIELPMKTVDAKVIPEGGVAVFNEFEMQEVSP